MVSFPQVSQPKPCISPPSPPIRATCSANLILLDFITRKILGEQYRSLSSSLCSFLHPLSIVPCHSICSYLAVRTYCIFSTEHLLTRHLAEIQFSCFAFCFRPIPTSDRLVLAGQCSCPYSDGRQDLAHLEIKVAFSAAISKLCHLNSNFLDARFIQALQLIFYDSTLNKQREKKHVCV